MKTLTVALPGREYDILIERGLLAQAGERCRAALPRAAKLAVVSDSNVVPLYGEALLQSLTAAGFEARLFTVPAGGPGGLCRSHHPAGGGPGPDPHHFAGPGGFFCGRQGGH